MKNVLGSLTLSLLFCGAVIAAPVPGARSLSAQQVASLTLAIDAARAEKPAVFAQVLEVKAALPRADKYRRGPLAGVGHILRALGPEAVPALVHALVVDGDRPAAMTETAWTAWQSGLLEALEAHADPLALPVLRAMVDHEENGIVLRSAASAYGAYGTDEVAAHLASWISRSGERRDAIVAGAGSCRRLVVAQALASALARETREAVAYRTVRSLAHLGNAALWELPSSRAFVSEESAARNTAAEGLLEAYVRLPGLRPALSDALVTVDALVTTTRLGQLRAAAPELGTDGSLARLSDRLARTRALRSGTATP
jgi:hypothetical protein